MLAQGYEESDFVEKTPTEIRSWSDTLTTLIALTVPPAPPTEEEVASRLENLAMP